MKCERCKENEAYIHIAEMGCYCLNCNNELVAELLGVDAYTDYPPTIVAVDEDGVERR